MEKDALAYGITRMVLPGDMALGYEYEQKSGYRYPSFQSFRAKLFELFPAIGRLTGSTTDYLIYASYFSPGKVKEMLSTKK